MVGDQALAKAKSAQRRICKEALASLTPPGRSRASASICSQLIELLETTTSGTVMGYMPLDDEPDILPFLEQALERGVVVCVPRITGPGAMVAATLASLDPVGWNLDRHGIRTPDGDEEIPPEQLDMVVVPGLGFDADGNRLGRGGGYYDRFLMALGTRPTLVGCCFQCQLLEAIETGPDDAKLSKIIMGSTGD